MASNCSSAARRSSAISPAMISGAGRLAASSSESSLSQTMSRLSVDTAAGVLGVTIAELASILEGTTKDVRANRVQQLVVQLRERTKRLTTSNASENTASG